MEFDNHFHVQAPLPLVWDFMQSPQEVTPCVPGAQITEVIDATHYKGTVKVKLGAVQMTYRGEVEVAPDESARAITLRAKGTDVRGSGGASGTVTSKFSESDGGTDVHIHSQVDVSGRVAQFGRGIMQDVATKLIREFSSCLEAKLAERAREQQAPEPQAAAEDAPASSSLPALDVPAQKSESVFTAGAPQPSPTETGTQPNNPATAPSELRISSLLVEVARSRIAGGLRALASLIEPR